MNKKGLLIVLSGPSGAGKGTVCKAFMERNPQTFLSVSATTRAPRPGEEEGVSYYFLSEEDFRNKIQSDGFLEHAFFCGNYYGTPKDAVFEKLDAGINVILEIEIQGAMQVRSHYPEGVYIFVLPPSMEELRARLEGRGTEDPDVIERRLQTARQELAMIPKYNYAIINTTVEEAVTKLEAVIVAEQCRVARNMEQLKEEFLV